MTTHLSELGFEPPKIFEIAIHQTREGGWRGHLSFAGCRRFPLPGWLVYDVAKRALVLERIARSTSVVSVGAS